MKLFDLKKKTEIQSWKLHLYILKVMNLYIMKIIENKCTLHILYTYH